MVQACVFKAGQIKMSNTHHLGHEAIHTYFDKNLVPKLVIKPGDAVVFATRESSYGRTAREYSAGPDVAASADLSAIISASAYPEVATPIRGHPLTGPVHIIGASPGDTLAISVLEIEIGTWGWTAARSGGGLLGEEAIERTLHYWDLRQRNSAQFAPGIRVPLQPFCGILGVAPQAPGMLTTTPPRNSGGNMDIRQLIAGSTLFLPVFNSGALFSVGDVHAAQGDGEVCGSGIECDASVTLHFDLLKGRTISEPQFLTAGPIAPCTDTGRHFAATGHNSDIVEASRIALRGIIDYLEGEHGISRPQGCILASTCVDLHISQIVNANTFTVTAFLPLSIFGA